MYIGPNVSSVQTFYFIYISYNIPEPKKKKRHKITQDMVNAVPPTNTKVQPLLLPTQAGWPYTNTHKHRTSYFKSALPFMGPAKRLKCLSAARQKREIIVILHHHHNNN